MFLDENVFLFFELLPVSDDSRGFVGCFVDGIDSDGIRIGVDVVEHGFFEQV